MYDYLIASAGLYGAVFAHVLTKQVIDRRDHIVGNIYTENVHGINIHKYGTHIFRASDREAWNYANRFAFCYHEVCFWT